LALAPELFGVDQMALQVDAGDGPEAGALERVAGAPPTKVAMRVDAPGAIALLAQGLRG
jgi:hypothetical protein